LPRKERLWRKGRAAVAARRRGNSPLRRRALPGGTWKTSFAPPRPVASRASLNANLWHTRTIFLDHAAPAGMGTWLRHRLAAREWRLTSSLPPNPRMAGHVHGNGAPFCLPCAARVNADQRDPGNKQGSFVLNGVAPSLALRPQGHPQAGRPAVASRKRQARPAAPACPCPGRRQAGAPAGIALADNPAGCPFRPKKPGRAY